MKKENIIISFVAVVFGILAAGIIFFLYQSTKVISPSKIKTVPIQLPTPTPKPSVFLSIDSPKDEEVSDSKIIKVSGKTANDAIVVVSGESGDQVLEPALNGDFSTTINIGDDENIVEITAIAPNGEEVKVIKTITFSAENF